MTTVNDYSSNTLSHVDHFYSLHLDLSVFYIECIILSILSHLPSYYNTLLLLLLLYSIDIYNILNNVAIQELVRIFRFR